MRWLLFTRPDCFLCDQVAALAQAQGLELEYRDISGDLALLERYGDRVPVIRDQERDRELCFPFDEAEFRAWVQEP